MKSLFGPKSYASIVTVSNIITSLGLVFIGIYVYGFLIGARWLLMASVFLAGCSDLLDGICARKLNQKTRIGEFLDPLRDRLLLLAVMANLFYILGVDILVIFYGAMIIIIESTTVICNMIFVPPQKRKVHLVGKLRQAAHLLLVGFAILSFYFRDVIFSVANINFEFPLDLVLPLMAICSCASAICYFWKALIEE